MKTNNKAIPYPYSIRKKTFKGLNRHFIIILVSLVIVILGYKHLGGTRDNVLTANELQQSIATKILRLHIRANSNSKEDQALKLKVKEAVTIYLEDILASSSSLQESKALVANHQQQLLALVNSTIVTLGYSYDVEGRISDHTFFPTREYGNIILPSGYYSAYEILIGSGQGNNWWCVLYPPLCFTDISTGFAPPSSMEQLQCLLSEDEYTFITTGKVPKPTIKFKFLTFLNS